MSNYLLASECGHAIYTTSPAPMGSNPIDFNIPYCAACTARRYEEELKLQYEQLLTQGPAPALKRRVSASHLATLEYTSPDNDAARRAAGRAEHGVQLLESPTRNAPRRRSSRVSFAEQGHRDEGTYREPVQYSPRSSQYEPGTYADTTGEGHLDTSDPNGERALKAAQRADEEEAERTFKQSLEDMTDEELEEYYRESQEALKRKRDEGAEAEND